MSSTDPYAAPTVVNLEDEKYTRVSADKKAEEAKVESATEEEAQPLTESNEDTTEATATVVETAPEGTVKSVLSWVDDDVDRAKTALAAEKASDNTRTSLVKALEEIIEDN